MTEQHSFDLIILGGGPAGIFAALRFAERNPSASIVVLEKTDRLLQKVLISGGGRCNLTHDCEDPQELINYYPRGGKSLLNAFYQFGPADIIRWFEKRGLHFYIDEIGCYFPTTDRSQSIIDVLLNECERFGIRTWTQAGAEEIMPDPDGYFTIRIANGDQLKTQRLVVATGGNRQALKMLQAIGEPIIAPIPSLFSFLLNDPRLKDLPGQSVSPATLSLPGTKFSQTGDLLITHKGLSGPAVINLSAWAARYFHENHYQSALKIDWLPNHGNPEQFFEQLWKLRETNGPRYVSRRSPYSELVQRLWNSLCQSTGIDPETRWVDLSKKRVRALAQELRSGQFQINGRNQQKQEYVTCGGVSLKGVHLKTMQSKQYSNLYYAGEVLNIDGLTGGYNLQNCWSNGWIVGSNLPPLAR